MSIRARVAKIQNLKKAWQNIYSGKSEYSRRTSQGIDGVSIYTYNKDIQTNLEKLSSALLSRSYRMSPLRGYFVQKSQKNKFRLITVPVVSDRIVQKSILETIKPYLAECLNTGASYCGIPNKKTGIKQAILKIIKLSKRGNFHIYESDIKGFFDNLNKELLLEKVISYLPDNTINDLIEQTVYFELGNYKDLVEQNKGDLPSLANLSKIGISQGSTLSPLFSNAYLVNFDNNVTNIFGDKFIRYVDDFVIIAKSPSAINKASTLIPALLKREELDVSKSKTKTCTLEKNNASMNFLGLNISKFQIRQKKNQSLILSTFNKKILNYSYIAGKYPHLNNTEEIITKMNSIIKGFSDYYRLYHTRPLLERLNALIDTRKKESQKYKKLFYTDASGSYEIININKWRNLFN